MFFKKSFKNTIRVSNSSAPDQARRFDRFVGPDLGPNCLQRLSAVATCGEGVQFHNPWRLFSCFVLSRGVLRLQLNSMWCDRKVLRLQTKVVTYKL